MYFLKILVIFLKLLLKTAISRDAYFPLALKTLAVCSFLFIEKYFRAQHAL